MSLINDLAQIREAQGKPPLPNPHVIQGFEPGAPPAPPFNPFEVDSPTGEVTEMGVDDPYLNEGPPKEEAPPSPLIPRRPRTEPHRLVPTPDADPLESLATAVAGKLIGGMAKPASGPMLAVLDRQATWKGREVALSESDERAVRAVVLKSIQRELQADLKAAGVQRVRRGVPAAEPASPAPRRRGRPRKVTP